MKFSRYAIPSEAGLPYVPYVLFLISIVFVIGVSGDLLALVGYNYVGSGGNPIEKIHPSTLTLMLGVGGLFFYRNGRKVLQASLGDPAIFTSLCCSCFAIAYSQLILGIPLAGLIVSWFTPALLLALLINLNRRQIAFVEHLLHILMLINSVMGVIEFSQSAPLIPSVLLDYVGEGREIDTQNWGEWRSSGLFGHPLAATLLCGVSVITVYTLICFRRASRLQVFTLLHCLAVMPLFGGRTSIFLTILFAILMSLVRLWIGFVGRSPNKINVFKVVLAVIFVFIAAVISYQAGVFAPLIERMIDDNGSGFTRLAALEIASDTPWPELFFGDFNGLLLYRQIMYGTIYGIEIFWVGMVLTFGLFISFVLFFGAFRILQLSANRFTVNSWWVICFYFSAISSGVGLVSKSTSFSALLLFLVMLRK